MGEAAATGPGLGWRDGDVWGGKQMHQGGGAEEWATGNTNIKVREEEGSWRRRSDEGCSEKGQECSQFLEVSVRRGLKLCLSL